ncbi:hypothetical protein [Bulleidia sp. zg-1006]|uniref:hypothetical protein n=1 Tax=Bulleidia sp. zg-1006 TaxID=2806552 RepID=UPI0019398585|nr:hypothetical protein [Bulleidia sp. zg-1006]QRG86155.1 hypothetical protein JOS54_04580 [Bulleidia sp. zg-1006]
MSKAYFKYLYQSKRILWNFLTLIFFAICFTPLLSSWESNYDRLIKVVSIAFILALILSFVLPGIFFSVYQRRKSADQYFSLPLSRKTLLVTTIGFAWVFVFMNWLLVTLLAQSILRTTIQPFQYFIIYIIYMAVIILVLLLIHSVLFLVANNIFDGVVMTFAYSFVFMIVFYLQESFSYSLVAGKNGWSVAWFSQLFKLFSPEIMVTEDVQRIFLRIFLGKTNMYTFNSAFYPPWFTITLLLIYGIIATVGLTRYFIRRSSENAELVSNDVMAYPFIVHVYLFGLMMAIAFQYWNIPFVAVSVQILVLLVAYVVAMFVYRRKITLSKNNVISFILAIILSFGIAFAGRITKGFGLANQYKLKVGEELVYSVEEYEGYKLQVRIPVNKMNQYKEVVDIMERYRKSVIDKYYKIGANSKERWIGYFDVHNETKTNKFLNRYSYNIYRPLNDRDIDTLKKYPEIVEFKKAEE